MKPNTPTGKTGDPEESPRAETREDIISPSVDVEKPHILLADDDQDTRAFLLRLLNKDYTVTAVSDGLEAITAAKDCLPDLIISDVMMPYADGYDLLEHLRAQPETSDLPVILLSARADSTERTRGLEKGARDYIAKPLDSRELLARIKIHLQLAQSRRAAEAQIRNLTDRLFSVQDKERKRIARDLHDQIGQQLTALRFQLETLRAISREANLVERIEETQSIAKQLDSDIDFLTWELHSSALECVDIVGALANYVSEWSRRFGVLADFQIKDLNQGRLTPDVKTNLYRIVQEGLHNIAKHARATRARVLIQGSRDNVDLSVEDDGAGFDVTLLTTIEGGGTGIGVIGMKERAAAMGAEFTLDSSPDRGTEIRLRIPLAHENVQSA